SVDLQGAHDEDVVVICEADVEPGLHAEAGRVYEIGVIFACQDQDDRRGSGAAGLTPPWSDRLDVLGVTPQTGGFDSLCHSLQQRIVAATSRPPTGAALQVELFLDLVAAGIGDLMAEVPQLHQVTAERSL